MQYVSIDYSHNYKMKWLSKELQALLYAASITTHEPTKKELFEKIVIIYQERNHEKLSRTL